VRELQKRSGEKRYGDDAVRQLRGVSEDRTLPEEVREAAERLQSRVAEDFSSPSRQPLADAAVIINFIKQKLTS